MAQLEKELEEGETRPSSVLDVVQASPPQVVIRKPDMTAEEAQILEAFKNIGRLPDETKLEILSHVLVLPHGIHSNRWGMLQKILVDPLLYWNKEVSQVVPDALYRYHPLTIAVREERHGMRIIFPKPIINHHVRSLEISFYCHGQLDACLNPQLDFLHRLQTGQLGFENLQVLKLSFDPTRSAVFDEDRLTRFVLGFLASCPKTFRAKKLEVCIDGHECDEGCATETYIVSHRSNNHPCRTDWHLFNLRLDSLGQGCDHCLAT